MRSAPLALGFVVLWSSGFVGASLAAGVAPPATVLAWRYVVTAAILIGALLVRRTVRAARTASADGTGSQRPTPGALSRRELGQQVILGLLAHGVYLAAVYAAVGAGVSAGMAALVAALQPMLVVAAGALLWGDPVGGRTLLGLGVGLLAVALTVGAPGAGAGAAALLPVVGLAALSGVALLERRWQPGTDDLTGLTVQASVAAAGFAVWASATGAWGAVTSVDAFLPPLAWQVLLSGLGGYTAFVLSLRRLGASATSTLLYLTPPVTPLWAWAMLAERPAPGELLGLVLGAVAVALVLGASTGTVRARPAGRGREAGVCAREARA